MEHNKHDERDSGDRRLRTDRRFGGDRRHILKGLPDGVRLATWKEQLAQCLTRYLFLVLGFAYFNLSEQPADAWPGVQIVNIIFSLYGLAITVSLIHAYRKVYSPWRWRLAMFVDFFTASVAVVADPTTISPGYMVYVMIILGNGMRYGHRIFAEAVVASLVFGAMVSLIQYTGAHTLPSMRVVFMLLFSIIVVIYAYFQTAELDRARERLETLSSIDMLTGVFNRRGLYEKADVLFRGLAQREGRVSVLFADLDKFKAINDALGHPAGDRALMEIAARLTGSTRGSDVVGRVGGDEFVLLLPDTDLHLAKQVAVRLRLSLAQWARESDLDLSVSIGIGAAPEHGEDFATVLAKVDQAMYRGKNSEGGGVHCVESGAFDEMVAQGRA